MTALFDRLSDVFERGHANPVDELLSDTRFAQADRTADAAVLIAVTDRPEPGLILTQRPQGMRDHPGQVALPGGKVDAGEDAITAALREADEELALRPHHVSIVGSTDRYQTGTGFDVTPVVGVIPPDLDLTPNPAEVEAWFEVPLSLVMERANWTQNEVYWRGEMRHYLEMDYQGFRIWGVTAGILANLSQRLSYKELINGR